MRSIKNFLIESVIDSKIDKYNKVLDTPHNRALCQDAFKREVVEGDVLLIQYDDFMRLGKVISIDKDIVSVDMGNGLVEEKLSKFTIKIDSKLIDKVLG